MPGIELPRPAVVRVGDRQRRGQLAYLKVVVPVERGRPDQVVVEFQLGFERQLGRAEKQLGRRQKTDVILALLVELVQRDDRRRAARIERQRLVVSPLGEGVESEHGVQLGERDIVLFLVGKVLDRRFRLFDRLLVLPHAHQHLTAERRENLDSP